MLPTTIVYSDSGLGLFPFANTLALVSPALRAGQVSNYTVAPACTLTFRLVFRHARDTSASPRSVVPVNRAYLQ